MLEDKPFYKISQRKINNRMKHTAVSKSNVPELKLFSEKYRPRLDTFQDMQQIPTQKTDQRERNSYCEANEACNDGLNEAIAARGNRG